MRFLESHDENALGPGTEKGIKIVTTEVQMIEAMITKHLPLYPKLVVPLQYHGFPVFLFGNHYRLSDFFSRNISESNIFLSMQSFPHLLSREQSP
jgi:hypothetical protein